MGRKKLVTVIIIVIVIATGVLIFNAFRKSGGAWAFETETPGRRDLSNAVTATGTLAALVTVEVGTQVSGIVERIYVDFNATVVRGQVIAEIDKIPLLAQLAQSQANVDDAGAELEYQTGNYNRIKALYDKQLVAQSDYDQAKYSYSRARASLANSLSVHSRNQINLDYATIHSPINGVVLDRVVDEGQTVTAGFTTPTLFTIANDLTQMQVEASVDEADIGRVSAGQRVEFTVDAYPDLTFFGTVTEVRLMPTIVSNVVTYTVIIDAPNPEQKLMPGMTASTVIYIEESSNTLVMPARALQFTPDPAILADYYNSLTEEERTGKDMGSGPHSLHNGTQPSTPPANESQPAGIIRPSGISAPAGVTGIRGGLSSPQFLTTSTGNQTIVWVKKGNQVRLAEIETGINTGFEVEVLKGLSDDDEVILSMRFESKNRPAAPRNNDRSPFMPGPPPGR